MTATIEDLDHELFTILMEDVSGPVCCGLKRTPCDRPATWTGRATCCQEVYFTCQEHMEWHVNWEQENAGRTHTCGARGSRIEWEKL